MSRTKRPLWVCLLAAAGLLAAAAPAPALVLHPDDGGPPPVRPPDDVVGQWMSNGSCVAIAPNYVITTLHQGGGVGGTVTIGGLTYMIAEEFDHSTADLRVVRLTNSDGTDANLSYSIPLYSGTDEAIENVTVVIGGYGKGRGSDKTTPDGVTYGYTWEGDSNSTLRWGANYVDTVTAPPPTSLYSLATLNADFDGPNAAPDQNHVSYEAAVAQWDSGGGWFINVGTEGNPVWQVAGLSHGAQNAVNQESLFLDSTDPTQPAPDAIYAVCVSTYANWIAAVEARSEWNPTSGVLWSTSGNWTPNVVPSGPDKFAVLGSKISGNQTVTLNSNVTLGTLRFDSAGNYTLSRSGGAKLIFSVTSGAATIDVVNLHGNAAHAITAPVTLNSHLIVTQDSAGDFTFSGAIGGLYGLIKQGAGTVVLATANSFGGGVEVVEGPLRVTAAGGMGSGPIILAGGSLDLRNDASTTTYAQAVTVSGDATISVANGGSGFGNKFAFNSLTIAGSRTLTVTGVSGYALEFNGQASLSNTASNATISTASADVAFNAGLTYLSGSLTKTGGGTMTVSGPQSYGGSTALNVAGGTVNLNSDVGAVSPARLAVSVSGSAALNMAATQHMASLDLAGTALATLSGGGTKTLVTQTLSIASATAKLDLTDNNLIVDYADGADSPYAQIRDYNQGRPRHEGHLRRLHVGRPGDHLEHGPGQLPALCPRRPRQLVLARRLSQDEPRGRSGGRQHRHGQVHLQRGREPGRRGGPQRPERVHHQLPDAAAGLADGVAGGGLQRRRRGGPQRPEPVHVRLPAPGQPSRRGHKPQRPDAGGSPGASGGWRAQRHRRRGARAGDARPRRPGRRGAGGPAPPKRLTDTDSPFNSYPYSRAAGQETRRPIATQFLTRLIVPRGGP